MSLLLNEKKSEPSGSDFEANDGLATHSFRQRPPSSPSPDARPRRSRVCVGEEERWSKANARRKCGGRSVAMSATTMAEGGRFELP